VILQPWGKVEGRLLIGDKPQAGQKVSLFRIGSRDQWMVTKIQHNLTTTTDKEGKFVFNTVAPGESWLNWEPRKRPLHPMRFTLVDVEPGKTLQQDIGGKGRPVVGRAASVPINAPTEKVSWVSVGNHSVDANYNNVRGTQRNVPANWSTMTEAQRSDWQKAWEKSPEGRAARRAQWSEFFEINPDGTFRIDDLVPGTYNVSFRIFNNENGFGEDLVECSKQFTVPPLPDGIERSNEPLDIGVVDVTLIPRTRVGKPAPEFAVPTLDGKTIKLSDFKGKYVVVKWWWNWSEMDIEAPAMKKAWQTMSKQSDWVLIDIAFDENIDIAKKRVADHDLPGIHCYVKDYMKQFPKEYMGSPSTICIIGPDGKVLGRNLQTMSLDNDIAKIILERQ
jgi:hypothetical protein